MSEAKRTSPPGENEHGEAFFVEMPDGSKSDRQLLWDSEPENPESYNRRGRKMAAELGFTEAELDRVYGEESR